jgi:hypothetical protein
MPCHPGLAFENDTKGAFTDLFADPVMNANEICGGRGMRVGGHGRISPRGHRAGQSQEAKPEAY